MAFSDPLILRVGGPNFHRIDQGVYVDANSNATARGTATIKSDLRSSGTSSFTVRRDYVQEGVGTNPDKALAVYLVVRGDFDTFNDVNIAPFIQDVSEFCLANTRANLIRVLRGER